MYSMSQQHHQMYYAAPIAAPVVPAAPVVTAPTRQYANHSNSSAFSSSANPDEDWTKISDLAERRRIQNRIAQRNYRKKLKRRLEDLERRAGSTDFPATPGNSKSASGSRSNSSNGKQNKPKKQQHTLSSLSAAAAAQQQQQQQQQQQRQASPYQHAHSQQHHHQPQSVLIPSAKQAITQSQFTPPLNPEDELLFAPTSYDDHRERSHTPPSMFSAYSAYPPPPEDILVGAYSSSGSSSSMPAVATAASAAHHTAYRQDATAYGYNEWAIAAGTVPVTLPPMNHFNDAIVKREMCSSDEAAAAAAAVAVTTMAPYMGFSFLPTSGIDAANPYDSNPHTPPLSNSYDHSTTCSDAGYDYPTTPLSMPGSPGIAA